MSRSEISTTSFDHEDLKRSLIDYLKSTSEFGDFNYEGSAINTMVDLLVRNSTYQAYLANMLANESFIGSAQIRANVVSHAEKLSYTPRSMTVSRVRGRIEVTPASPIGLDPAIEMPAGTIFLSSYDGTTFSFTTHENRHLLEEGGKYVADDIMLYQGQRLTNSFIYQGEAIEIPNDNVDTSTLVVSVTRNGTAQSFQLATSIMELSASRNVYFISQNHTGKYQIEFGRDVLGSEPANGAVITVTYVNAERTVGNGARTFVSATPVDGYSNVSFIAETQAYGGSEREDIESIRFIAPKVYQAQERALTGTDYAALVKQQFPYVRSMITWGGEENIPAVYGRVFMSIISEEGLFLNRTAKQDIVSYLKDYNVGSITPELVDPVRFDMNLHVRFDYDKRATNKTFNDLSAEVISAVSKYNEEEIGKFNRFYNRSKLTNLIMRIPGITTLSVDAIIHRTVPILRFADPIYSVDFANPIKKGSLTASGFRIDALGTAHKLYDENGKVYISYASMGATIRHEVGTIDYANGLVEFVANMTHNDKTLDIIATPDQENFLVGQNRYVAIDRVTTAPLTVRK